ncbi:MAG: hypothetical protein DMG45_21750 [Acidobacteria bacterium]|nr:MAG: hypothetical protein DMG45_21750 [Acidobacteriota bacterium]
MSWARTRTVRNRIGHRRWLNPLATFCTRAVRPIRCVATVASLSRHQKKKRLTNSCTIRQILCPRSAVGGSLCCDAAHYEPGPRDQRAVENRNDVLVYSTKPLAEDMEVTGPVTFELWASSSAVDTDFTAKLVDVSPGGFAMNLTDGVLRMRYRDSQEKPELMNPDQIYKISVDLWATGNVFKKGHILRLEVSSSNFPRFDRNLNTGADQATSREFVSATNMILHDAEHPSALLLPVIPAGAAAPR